MMGYGRPVEPERLASTGNDIVALKATQPERTCRPRFYSRILTASEQENYSRVDLPFDHYVWLCWSVKESAYKYRQRQQPGLVFSPLKIVISDLQRSGDLYQGIVLGGPEPLYSRSSIREDVIVSVVSEDATFTGTCWGFQSIASGSYADQSLAVRVSVLQELKATLLCQESHNLRTGADLQSLDDLQIQKDAAGYPVILQGDRRLSIPVSLAHHDRYVAWSYYSPKV